MIYQHKNGTLIELKKDFGSVISGYILDSNLNRTERKFYYATHTATCIVSKSNLMEYETMSEINISCEDNMELMKRYPDNYFELAIVDPPYGIDLANMNMGIGNTPKASKAKNRKWKAKDWDNATPSEEYFLELFRVSKNQIIWGGNYFNLPPCKKFIIWDKEIPKGLSFSDCEFAWTSFSGANNMFRYSAYRNKSEKIHPTQKPPTLYQYCLDNFAKEGDKILDTHLGSGSIAIACHNLKFDLTACELDKEYYEAAMLRLRIHTMQQTLF